jgi:phospholipid-translocating ATPase
MIWLAAANGFSGQTVYNVLLYTCWNTFFTSMPIMVYCVTDQEFSYDYLEANPVHYGIGLSRSCFNTTRLWGYWIFTAVTQSLLIVLFTFVFLEFNYMPGGYTIDYWTSGTCIFSVLVIIANLELFMMHHVHNTISYTCILLSIVVFFIFFAVVSYCFENVAIYLSFSM